MARKPTQIKPSVGAHCIQGAVTPRLLPLKLAAEYLGLSTWALRERIWSGALPVVQFDGGRKQYLDLHDLDEFITKHKRVIE